MRREGLAAGLLCGGTAAYAALWGYVDGQGTAHFAERQIDSRYGLVIADSAASAPPIAKVPGKTNSPSSVLTWLEIAPEVKRVQPWVREAASLNGVDSELINALIAVRISANRIEIRVPKITRARTSRA